MRTLLAFSSLAILAIAAFSLWIWGGFGLTTSAQSHRVVLFSPDTIKGLPDQAALEQAGVTVVHSQEELAPTVDGTTRAVIISAAAAENVDGRWLADQLAKGIVLGGINVSQSDLGAISGFGMPVTLPDGQEAPTPPLDTGERFGDEPFFTLAYEVANSRGGMDSGARGAISLPLTSATDMLKYVERYISTVEQIR